MTNQDEPCINCITYPVCKQRVLTEVTNNKLKDHLFTHYLSNVLFQIYLFNSLQCKPFNEYISKYNHDITNIPLSIYNTFNLQNQFQSINTIINKGMYCTYENETDIQGRI